MMNSQPQQFLFKDDRSLKTSLFRVENESISLLWLLKVVLGLLIVIILSALLKRFLKHQLSRRREISQGNQKTISTLLGYSVSSLGFVLVLHANRLTLAPLTVTLGGLGIGISLGFQEFAKNLISGVTLLFEGKLQVDGYVEFEGLSRNISGHIKEISLRSTVIRTSAGGDFVVPNSSLISNRVLNWSYRSFTGQLHLPIKVVDDRDPVLVTETLLNSAYMEPRVLHEPTPKVIFKGFVDSSLEFALWVWVAHVDERIAVESSLNFILDYSDPIWIVRKDSTGILSHKASHLTNALGLLYNLHQIGLKSPLPANTSRQGGSIRDVLRALSHFNAISDLELGELIETGHRKSVAKSDVIFKEGATGSSFYLILSGSVETVVARLSKDIKVYHAGDVFWEAAIMLNLPYATTARALENTNLFVIHKPSFEKFLRLHPDVAEAFGHELTKETEVYQEVRQQLQDLGLLSATEKHHRFTDWVRSRLKRLL